MLMASSLVRVLLNRPLFCGHATDKGGTVVMLFRRSLVKKPKSVIGSNIKSSIGMNSAKAPSVSHKEQLRGPMPRWMKTSSKIGLALVAIEIVLFSAAYLNWRQLNLDQEHRFEMGQSWWGCYLLDAYYRMGEYMDSSCKMRDFDLKTWQSEGKPAPLKVKFSIL